MTLSDDQLRWVHLWLTDQVPSAEDRVADRASVGDDATLPDGPYMIIDPRFVPVHALRKHLLLYTSCHAHQIVEYLRQFRQDVMEQYYVHVLYTHRMDLAGVPSSHRLVRGLFNRADAIICNILGPKFGERSTEVLFKNCDPGVKVVSFVPPNCACWWPVLEHFGEEPVREYLKAGKTIEEMIELFRQKTFDPRFDFRFTHQIQRLAFLEQDLDVKISRFVQRHYKTHKLWFTENHPTFHLIAYIVEEALGHLGFEKKPEEHALEKTPVNGAGFGDHFPETAYEWDFYGFTYPRRWENDRGGAESFYSDQIRKIVARNTQH